MAVSVMRLPFAVLLAWPFAILAAVTSPREKELNHITLRKEVEAILRGDDRVPAEAARLREIRRDINRAMASLQSNAGVDAKLDQTLWAQHWASVREYVEFAERLRARDLRQARPTLERLQAEDSIYHDALLAWIHWEYLPGPVDLKLVREHAFRSSLAGNPDGSYIAGMVAETVAERRAHLERGVKLKSIDCALALAELSLVEKDYASAYRNARIVEHVCGYAPVGTPDSILLPKLRADSGGGPDGEFAVLAVKGLLNEITGLADRDALAHRARSVMAEARPHYGEASSFDYRIKASGLTGILDRVLLQFRPPVPDDSVEPNALAEMRELLATEAAFTETIRRGWMARAELERSGEQMRREKQAQQQAEQQAYLDRLDRERAEREQQASKRKNWDSDEYHPLTLSASENATHPQAILPVRKEKRGLGALMERTQRHSTRPDEVLIIYIVDASGDVVWARATEYGYREAAEAAEAMVRRWKFSPGTIAGKAVPMSLKTTITFTQP